jgi:hypothetical protein
VSSQRLEQTCDVLVLSFVEIGQLFALLSTAAFSFAEDVRPEYLD